MTVEYRLTPEDVLRFCERAAPRSPFFREVMTRGRWLTVAIFLALGTIVAWLSHRWEILLIVTIAALFAYMMYPDNFLKGYLRRAKRYHALEGPPCLGQVHTLEVLPTGIRTGCTSCDTSIAWSRVEVQEVNDDTFIFIGPSNGWF